MADAIAAPAPAPAMLGELEPALDDIDSVRKSCAAFREIFARLKREIGKVVVGQDEVVEQTLISLFGDGHVLLEGVPGLGKTLLVRTLSQTLTLPTSRIQFTPDLMPADITGTSLVVENATTGHREFTFRPGPIFTQLLLADEINRATPKSQAALLEAMQEKSVTVGGTTRTLNKPFFVMATQNPIEQEGTYPLPEAQLDRFFFKIIVPYATRSEMNAIVGRTTANESARPLPVIDSAGILAAQKLVRRIVVAPHVQDYLIRLVLATHPRNEPAADRVYRYIRVGVSPRGAQALISAARVRALVDGRFAVAFHDIHRSAYPALRHRIMRSFEADADAVTTDAIIQRLIEIVPHEFEEEEVQLRRHGGAEKAKARKR